MLSVAIDIAGRSCLVVGGGNVAARRAQRLIAAGGEVTVVAPEAVDDIRQAPLLWEQRSYRTGDVDGMVLAVTATGNPDVDSRVVHDALAAGVFVNDASEPSRGDLVIPAATTSGPIVVSVHTGGRSPALSSWFVERIQRDLDDGFGELVELMASARVEMQSLGRPTTQQGWRRALDAGLLDLVRSGDAEGARRLLWSSLEIDDR